MNCTNNGVTALLSEELYAEFRFVSKKTSGVDVSLDDSRGQANTIIDFLLALNNVK